MPQQTLTDYLDKVEDRNIKRGLVGYYDSSTGQYVTTVPGRSNYVFVRTGVGSNGFGGVVEIAESLAAVSNKLPVVMKVKYGKATVQHADAAQLSVYGGGTSVYATTVPTHNHAVGSANPDPVEGLRFLPGLVHPRKVAGAYGLSVFIEEFFYKRYGSLVAFPGQLFDLTSVVPSTSGKKSWIVVGVDPSDNTPFATAGSEYSLPVAMLSDMIEEIDLTGKIPLGALVLTYGQTSIGTIKPFKDVRPYYFEGNDIANLVNAIGSIGGGTQDIDLNLGATVTGTVDTSATTFTFSNPPPSGMAGRFTLILTNGGSQTVNWPGSVQWAGGTGPTLTSSGVDVLRFMTPDGGTTWYGETVGLNYS